MASERERTMLLPLRTAGAALMALLMLALLSFAQAEVSGSTAAASGGAGISTTRQGDPVALLRVTGKAQALEVRAGRTLPVKIIGGNSVAPAAASGFLTAGQPLPADVVAAQRSVATPPAHSNQPRAPPVA